MLFENYFFYDSFQEISLWIKELKKFLLQLIIQYIKI